MKWKKPGHEFDDVKEEILNEYADRDVFIYGAGVIGERVFRAIKKITDWKVIAFVDKNKAGSMYHDIEILNIAQLKSTLKSKNGRSLIIVALDEACREVREQLLSFVDVGQTLCKLQSEFLRQDFPIIAYYQYRKILVNSLSCIVTEACTLNCEKCSIMLPYFRHRKQYSLEEVKREIDLAFEKIDFICDFTVTGGEPLLNSDLAEILSYTGEHYAEQIGNIKIITNGVLEPDETLLHCMKTYDIFAFVSDYTEAVQSIRERVLKHYKKFCDAEIRAYLASSAKWVDFGFGAVSHTEEDESELIAFFNNCRTTCRGYIDGKVWYCINARFAEQALEYDYDLTNALDLTKVGNTLEERAHIIEFDAGYNKRGYLSMCNACNGGCDINTHFIDVGKQCSPV